MVHCQPVGKGLGALKYLAPYIFRVAISNNRILKLADGKVTFRYRTTDTGKLETCTLPTEEFIRRFSQHVLPKGFVKVRYYGFLASGCRQQLAALPLTSPHLPKWVMEMSKMSHKARQISQPPAASSCVPRVGGLCSDGQFVPANNVPGGAAPLDR